VGTVGARASSVSFPSFLRELISLFPFFPPTVLPPVLLRPPTRSARTKDLASLGSGTSLTSRVGLRRLSEEEETIRTMRARGRTRRTFTLVELRGAFLASWMRTKHTDEMRESSGLSVEDPNDKKKKGGMSDVIKGILAQARECVSCSLLISARRC
jgi:hypothetical protein